MTRRKTIFSLVLLLLLGAAWLLAQPNWLRQRLVKWFGPPQVELQESYAEVAGVATFDHSAFGALLADHVDGDGFVDYSGLQRREEALESYIESLATAPFEAMSRDERLALLINAYNAFTLRLILDHYPTASIRDIPDDQRWKAVRWRLAGSTYSLDQIEHELVRPNFREPRIHFVLVCAAVGCPTLRPEAYTAERLEEQLEAQTRLTHDSPRWVRYDAGTATLELTSLYEWYGGDFEQVAGSVLAYVARYRSDLAADLDQGRQVTVRFLDYDWSLNDQRSGARTSD